PGEDHEAIARPREVVAITGDPRTEALWGIDASTGELVQIDQAEGGALPVAALPPGATAIALDPRSGDFWVAAGSPATLYRVERGGAAAEVASLGFDVDGLAFDPATASLFAGGERLRRIDIATGSVAAFGTGLPSGAVSAPAVD